MSALTHAQEQALERVRQLLHEHFETAVIGVLAVVDRQGGGQDEVTHVFHTGGRMAAIGLAAEAQRAIITAKSYEQYEGPDDREKKP